VLGRGVARRTSRRDDGSQRQKLVANNHHTPLGGAAVLRNVSVHPDRFEVRTYSPHLDAEKRDEDNQFTLRRG
jgi:hypothetical protein